MLEMIKFKQILIKTISIERRLKLAKRNFEYQDWPCVKLFLFGGVKASKGQTF